jgi:hypothetical protein
MNYKISNIESTQPIQSRIGNRSSQANLSDAAENDSTEGLRHRRITYSNAPLPFPPEGITPETAKGFAKIIKERKITFLTHFTRLENLTSILKNGLISRGSIQSNPEIGTVRMNEPVLPNPWHWAVSFNISFPNYRLFYKLQERMGFEWVVLLFDINLLMSQSFYFFPYPASNLILSERFPTEISPFLQKVQSFEKLFSDTENVRRSILEIPSYYPTNPQSEVLTFSNISMQFLREIHFFNDYKFNQWFLQNADLALSMDKKIWHSGLTFFSPRCDYIHWKSRS